MNVMNSSRMRHSIRYLDQDLRFITSDVITVYFDIDESLASFVKSKINLIIIKKFCDLAKNTILVKK